MLLLLAVQTCKSHSDRFLVGLVLGRWACAVAEAREVLPTNKYLGPATNSASLLLAPP